VPSSDEPFNVCDYLLDRHIRAGRGDRLALTGTAGDVSYAELAERVGHAAGKQRVLGPAELAAVGLAAPSPGEPVANEWWRVTDGGEVAGYGWLDSEWGDARITFVVAPGRRGRGVGAFILEHLEDEAAARGLNYIYNVVPETHPDGAWIRNWLSTHGFHEASRGQLRRQVVPSAQVMPTAGLR
jgi:GNAT superfamily N-acetyltransferase